jgi:hypothetical protein
MVKYLAQKYYTKPHKIEKRVRGEDLPSVCAVIKIKIKQTNQKTKNKNKKQKQKQIKNKKM